MFNYAIYISKIYNEYIRVTDHFYCFIILFYLKFMMKNFKLNSICFFSNFCLCHFFQKKNEYIKVSTG